MKEKLILSLSTLLMLSTTVSCNGSGIKRDVYKEDSFENALATHSKIKKAQSKGEGEEATTTLFDNGVISYKHDLKCKGTVRVSDLSFKTIDINLSTDYTISWSIKDKYLKIKGDNEIERYVYDDPTKKYWKLEDFNCGDKDFHDKTDITTKVEEYKSFADFVEDNINFYTTVSIPTVCNITLGITGEQYEYETIVPIFETDVDYCTDYFFNSENNAKLNELIKKYKDENQGYSLNAIYGVKNNNSTCLSLNGKVNVRDFHDIGDYKSGYLNIDAFSSFKDNFISQVEIKANGRVTNERKLNLDTNIDFYVSEQVNQDGCTKDTYDLSKYTLVIED